MPGPGECKPKLYYFNVKSKSYPIKMIFNLGGVDFEDVKFDFQEYSKLKKDMPMGQVPVVEYNGVKMCQSMAIAEFAAEKANLTPKDTWMKCKVTEMICCCDDVYQKCMASKNDPDKKETRGKMCKESLPEFFTCMDKMIAANNCPGFCVGSKMTAADVYVCCMVDQFKCGQFEYVPTTICDNYSNMMKVYDTMMQNPKVKECKSSADMMQSMKY